MVKMVGWVKRRQGMTREEFSDYWLNVHAPLALRFPGLRRYVQNVAVGDSEFDGVAECWFDDEKAMNAARESDAFKVATANLPNFLDDTMTLRLVVVERPIVA